MTRPAQPSHVLQVLLPVPASLDCFSVDESGNQMVICKRHPVSLTHLTFADLATGCRWCGRGGGDSRKVGGQHGREKVGDIFCGR